MEKLHCVEKEYQKVKRIRKRIADNNMNMHDLYILSCHLHKKFKAKEKDKHNYKR